MLVQKFFICLILMIYYKICTEILLHLVQCLISVSLCQCSLVVMLLGVIFGMLLESS